MSHQNLAEFMTRSTPVEKIRKVVAAQLGAFGAQEVESLSESLLIRNGLFCGRRFQCDSYEVVWFLEEDEIKYFSPCGELLKCSSAISAIHEYESVAADEPQKSHQSRRAA